MLSVGWSALMFLCAVGPLIIFHELGHYWVARWCGVRAETFSIGFGSTLASWVDKRGTRWRIAALPLGGYVKFAGEYELDGSPSKHQPYDGFEVAHLWQRALIIAAGPMANFVVAFVIFCILIGFIGEPVLSNRVAVIEAKSVAQASGFKPDDQVLAINGQATPDFDQIRSMVLARPNQALHFTIKRGSQTLALTATPALGTTMDQYQVKSVGGHLGIGPAEEIRHPAWYLVPGTALALVGKTIAMIATVLGKIATGQLSASNLGGPLKTAQKAAEVASYGWIAFLSLIAFISINLGFINLLPVPVLDGGHLALYGLEALRRKPLTSAVRERVFKTGLAMLLALFVFVTVNDLGSFGVWKQLVGLIG